MVISKKFTLAAEPPLNIKPVMTDGVQLDQAVMNLARNAQESTLWGCRSTMTVKSVNNYVEKAFSGAGEGLNVGNKGRTSTHRSLRRRGALAWDCQAAGRQYSGTLGLPAPSNEEPSGQSALALKSLNAGASDETRRISS